MNERVTHRGNCFKPICAIEVDCAVLLAYFLLDWILGLILLACNNF